MQLSQPRNKHNVNVVASQPETRLHRVILQYSSGRISPPTVSDMLH